MDGFALETTHLGSGKADIEGNSAKTIELGINEFGNA